MLQHGWMAEVHKEPQHFHPTQHSGFTCPIRILTLFQEGNPKRSIQGLEDQDRLKLPFKQQKHPMHVQIQPGPVCTCEPLRRLGNGTKPQGPPAYRPFPDGAPARLGWTGRRDAKGEATKSPYTLLSDFNRTPITSDSCIIVRNQSLSNRPKSGMVNSGWL